MDNKYNKNIICQIEMIDTKSNIFEISWNFMNIQKSAIFETFLKLEPKHGAHLQYVFYPCMKLW